MQSTAAKAAVMQPARADSYKPGTKGETVKMNEYIRRLRSGKAVATLRPHKLITGVYGVEVKLYNKNSWEPNISLPLFNNAELAEKWLLENYEKRTNEE